MSCDLYKQFIPKKLLNYSKPSLLLFVIAVTVSFSLKKLKKQQQQRNKRTIKEAAALFPHQQQKEQFTVVFAN